MLEDLDPLISVPAAAKAVGVDRSVLGKQVRQGFVRSHDGKVRLSEVLADRAANIDLGRSKRRDGAIDKPAANARAAKAAAPVAVDHADDHEAADDDDDDGDGGAVMVDGVPVSYADARALKETYLAKLKQLEYEAKRGEQAPIKAMLDRLDRDYAVVRERLLTVPGKMSGQLGFTREQIEFVTDNLYEAMEELSARGAAAELHCRAVRDDDDGEADGVEAPAAPQPRRVGGALPVRRAKDQRRAG